MGDYSDMANYYDDIMTSGYYDYESIALELIDVIQQGGFRSVLEIGCGTGSIIEPLVNAMPDLEVFGCDLTQAMIGIARQRLRGFANVTLSCENVTDLKLRHPCDVAFSYGGVWYFVVDGDKEPFVVSHISDHEDNVRALARVAADIAPGGQLLLGIQGPHHDYSRPIANGMVYAQEIHPHGDGFVKHYHLDDGPRRVMSQSILYRTYTFDETLAMLDKVGLHLLMAPCHGRLFSVFGKPRRP